MSYQVLARKWRPATFEQLVGQSHVLQALTNALSQQRLHHAYLFTGTRGVGKTTLARLFAKGLNCEQGITAHPCGKCASCIEIAEGRFVDLIEVDAASRTKVDDTRELLDNVQYRPTRGRFKVYLIDEVHMLSRSSFNALLKTLEEPPEHVKFLLATTDPHKLPVTVLSRCLQFNLKSLNLNEIQGQLNNVLTKEHIKFEENALALLAKSANGSMRDALSLTDQAIAFGAGKVMLKQVQTMLGTIDDKQVIALFNGLVNGDIANLMDVTSQVLSFGADADEVLRSLLELLHQITLTQFAPAAAQLSIYQDQIIDFAKQLTPEQIQLYYQLLLTGRKDLPHAPDPKSGLEMALLRAVAFIPERSVTHWDGGSFDDDERNISNSNTNQNSQTNKPVINKQEPNTAEANPVETSPVKAIPIEASQMKASDSTVDNLSSNENALTKQDNISAEQDHYLNDHFANEQNFYSTETIQKNGNDSLLAEQSLIVSQAHSMGYQDQTESSIASTSNFDISDVIDDKIELSELSTLKLAEEHEQVNQEASADPLDDILDAVLKSRESLMSQLSINESENKSVVATPTKKPLTPKKSMAVKTAPSNDIEANSHSFSPENVRTVRTHKVDVSDIHINDKSTTSCSDDDLPPWEERQDSKTLVADTGTQNVQPIDANPHNFLESATENAETQIGLAQKNIEAHANTQIVQQDLIHEESTTLISDLNELQGEPLDLHWYKQITLLNIGGRIRQLAVNSVCLNWSEQVVLLLKPDQKHLSVKAAVEQLQQALANLLDKSVTVDIQIGVVPQRETPREVRHRFHQELLNQAQNRLMQDDNVCWLSQNMGATLESDTLVYPPELMAKRSQSIPLLSQD